MIGRGLVPQHSCNHKPKTARSLRGSGGLLLGGALVVEEVALGAAPVLKGEGGGVENRHATGGHGPTCTVHGSGLLRMPMYWYATCAVVSSSTH